MNKEPNFAGSFYPASSEEIYQLLNSYTKKEEPLYKSKAVIVPHAGYVYSGHAAMMAFNKLEPSETIFIIAPSHKYAFENIALPKYTYFDTPIGSIEVNNLLIKEIAEKFPCVVADEPFQEEHSIEVQLPFLQYIFYPQRQSASDFVKNLTKLGKKLRIVPILVGKCDYKLISDIIAEYWENASFVISSDLSHFYNIEECRQIDTYTATLIENGKIESFEPEQACGLIGVKGLVDFANKNGFSLIRAEMYNSGDVSDDKERVVGYGSWFLYTGKTNDYIEQYYYDYILNTAKKSICSAVEGEEYLPSEIPTVLTQLGASFVTIKLNDNIRGCIGSVYPTKPLILDIIDNARNAAFYDSRFEPITERELTHIEISVSILSPVERIFFKDEKDLLNKIYPHGIIVALKDRRAVYLPLVWEQLPDRDVFFNSLKEKAGIPSNYFSRAIEVYKFDTKTFQEIE